MNKRKSTNNYVRDNRTGETIEEVKYKPLGEELIGRTTITLNDKETGAEDVVAVSENVITEVAHKTAFLDAYGYALETTLGRANRLFDTIVLTDSKVPESEETTQIYGDVVGYVESRSTEPTSDLKTGVFNEGESVITDFREDGKLRLKLVYDFPTNAGNGIINSVFWLPETSMRDSTRIYSPHLDTSLMRISVSNTSYSKGLESVVEVAIKSHVSYPASVDSDGVLHAVGTGSDSGMAHFFADAKTFSDEKMEERPLMLDDETHFSFYGTSQSHLAIDVNKKEIKAFFYVGRNATSHAEDRYTFYMYTFDYEGNFLSSEQISEDDLVIDGEKVELSNWFFDDEYNLCSCGCIRREDETYFTPIVVEHNQDMSIRNVVDITDTIVDAYNMEFETDEYHTEHEMFTGTVSLGSVGIGNDASVRFLTSVAKGSNIGVYLDRKTKQLQFTSRFVSTPINNDYIIKGCRGTNKLLVYAGRWSVKHFSFINMVLMPSAHNKLPSTVEKTDSHTMKVEYEFIMDFPELSPDKAPVFERAE